MLPTKTAVILATGPSLTKQVLEIALNGQEQGLWSVYGMNRLWRDFPTLDGFLACNPEFFDVEWERGLKDITAQKWTWDKKTAAKYKINYIDGLWKEGFSKDPKFIHYGHSSGFQVPQIAYHAGFRRFLLCGYDMAFASDYDGKNKRIGSSPRHYFGEYEDKVLNHWPSVKVRDGVHIELIEHFSKVPKLNPEVEIINCSPGSAMKCFPMANLIDFLTPVADERHNRESSEVSKGVGRRTARNTLRLRVKDGSDEATAKVDTVAN
jgi:hypothetical protein